MSLQQCSLTLYADLCPMQQTCGATSSSQDAKRGRWERALTCSDWYSGTRVDAADCGVDVSELELDGPPPDRISIHGGYERGAHMAARMAQRDPRPSSQGEIVPSAATPFDNFPAFIARAEGAHLWDVDGNRYVDFLLGYGAVILGHNHPAVQRAARIGLDEAVCQSPFWSPSQLQLVERLTSVIPGAEMSFLLRTGSDATSCAVRIARIATGRSTVVRAGYNGWHDWCSPFEAGVPESVRQHTIVVDVGDLSSLERAVASVGQDLAAIVTMPYEHEAPHAAYVDRVVELARANGALFVLDEVRSGFRVALGGAQELLHVKADLVCLSKAMANGYSISAVTGSAPLLSLLKETKVSSTFFANRAEHAAALATIDVLERTQPFQRIAALGTRLMEGFNAILVGASIDAALIGHPSSPYLRVQGDEPSGFAVRLAEDCARRGAVIHPAHQWFISAAHTEADIDLLLEAVSTSLGAGVR